MGQGCSGDAVGPPTHPGAIGLSMQVLHELHPWQEPCPALPTHRTGSSGAAWPVARSASLKVNSSSTKSASSGTICSASRLPHVSSKASTWCRLQRTCLLGREPISSGQGPSHKQYHVQPAPISFAPCTYTYN